MLIPSKAKRVFQGEIFAVYQWEQELFDGSMAVYEMLSRPDTAQVMLIEGDQIVLAKESQPHTGSFYSLIGGRAEEGEEPLQAAKRELLEETGMASQIWEPFAVYRPFAKCDWRVHLFLARDAENLAEPRLDGGERIELVRVSFEQFLEIVLSDEFRGREFAYDLCRRLYHGQQEELKRQLCAL